MGIAAVWVFAVAQEDNFAANTPPPQQWFQVPASRSEASSFPSPDCSPSKSYLREGENMSLCVYTYVHVYMEAIA